MIRKYIRKFRSNQQLSEYPFGVFVRLVLSRVVSAYLSFLLPNRHIQVTTKAGKIYLNLKESQWMLDRALGVYEYWKTELFTSLMKPNMTVLDIGGNKGYYSLLAAKLCGDSGSVYTFEPLPENCKWIDSAFKDNGYRSVELVPVALSNRNGSATFFEAKKSGGGTLIEKSNQHGAPITVITKRLDDFLDEKASYKAVDVIKMDVEGAEMQVLEGAAELLRNSQRLKLLIDIHSQQLGEDVFDLLQSHGFKMFTIERHSKEITDKAMVGRELYAVKN
jgi:FkbM family methyltransferase